jgi:hypothetical protein
MKKLSIEPTKTTPLVEFDPQTNEFLLQGVCLPEEPIILFKRIVEYTHEYISTNPVNLTVNVKIEFFNTASSKLFLELLKIISANIKNVVVNWFYEEDDDDILDFWKDLKSFIPVTFNFNIIY